MKRKINKIVLTIVICVELLFVQNSINVKAAVATNPRIANNVTTWDCIYFGNYYQNYYTPIEVPSNLAVDHKYIDKDGTEFIYRSWTNRIYDEEKQESVDVHHSGYFKKQPIKWRVLSVDKDGNAIVMADKGIDFVQYNTVESEDEDKSIWEKSTLRSWLNGYGNASNSEHIDYSSNNFINQAFTNEEQSAIIASSIKSGNDVGDYVTDKISILSDKEVSNSSYGFNMTFWSESQSRVCELTGYAKSKTEYVANNWWTRDAYVVTPDGSGCYYLYEDAGNADADYVAVRPTLKINLNAAYVKPASAVKASVSGEFISHTHNYSSKVVRDATCQSAGIITYTCECDDSYTESIPKNPTKHVDETEIKGAADPKIGVKGYTGDVYCKGCGVLISKGASVPAISLRKQKISVKNVTVRYSKLRRKKMAIKLNAKTDGNGALSYKVTKYPKGMKKYISVSPKGKVTLRKKAKKGTYKITITASKVEQFDSAKKVVIIKVKK